MGNTIVLQEHKNVPIYTYTHNFKDNTYKYYKDNKILNNIEKINLSDEDIDIKNKIFKLKKDNIYYLKISNFKIPNKDIILDIIITIDKKFDNIFYNIYINKETKENLLKILYIEYNDKSIKIINEKKLIVKNINFEITFLYDKENKKIINDFKNIDIDYIKKCTGKYIYNNTDNIKYTTLNKIVKNIHKVPYCIYTKDMIIFNKKTLRLYYIKNKYYAGSQILRNILKQSIHDITFRLDNVSKNQYDFYDIIKDYLKDYFKEEYDYTKQDLINRYPKIQIDKFDIGTLLSILFIKKELNIKNTYLANFIYRFIRYRSKIFSKLKNKTEKEILSYLKINKNIIMMDDILFYKYYELFDFFENTNDVIQFLNTINKEQYVYHITNKYIDKKRNNFLYQYYKHNSKKRFFNQIYKNMHIITDCCNLYAQNKNYDNKYNIDYKNNINYIHDIMSKDNLRFKANNKAKRISQDKKLKEIFKNVEFNGLKYIPAKNTKELILAGSIMNICVASYAELALKKQCYIILGYDKNNIPKTCIELRKNISNEFSVIQVKKEHNSFAEKEENDFLYNFFIDNNITIDTCDLSNNINPELII